MTARTPADDAGDCSNVECTHSHGFADGRCVLSGCEQPPADDAGDVAALQAHIVKLRDRWERQKRLADEARAEVDSLRAEVERLRASSREVYAKFHRIEAERDSLRVTLAAVGDVVRTAGVKRASAGGAYYETVTVAQVQAALAAADPVSLADVRGEPMFEIRFRFSDGETMTLADLESGRGVFADEVPVIVGRQSEDHEWAELGDEFREEYDPHFDDDREAVTDHG